MFDRIPLEHRLAILILPGLLSWCLQADGAWAAVCAGQASSTCDDGTPCMTAATCPGQINCVSDCVGGSGSTGTECFLNLLGVRPNYPSDTAPDEPARKRTEIRCTDGEACDTDRTVNNRCSFELSACLANVDDSGVCPSTLPVTSVSVKNKTGARANSSLTRLQQQAALLLPASSPGCSAPTTIDVPVRASNCTRFKGGQATVAISATAGPEALLDKDKLKMRCLPAVTAACATIQGHVYGPKKSPLAGARVASDAQSVETGADGSFLLSATQAGKAVLRVSRKDYLSTIKSVETTIGAYSTTEISMMRSPAPHPVTATTGGIARTPDGSQVTFPANAFVDADGQPLPADSIVQVSIAAIDPSTDEILAFPGAFDAVGAGGEPEVLETVTLADISATLDGKALQLAAGKTALLELVIPIDAVNPATQASFVAGDIVPMYWLNPATGIWERQGSGTVAVCTTAPEPLCVQAQLDHLSWWNADYPMEITCLRGKAIDQGAVPVAGAHVLWEGLDFNGGGETTTNPTGDYCVLTRVDSSVRLSAISTAADGLLFTGTIPAVSTPATPADCATPSSCAVMQDIVIPETRTCIRGRVVTLANAPVDGAFVHGANMAPAATGNDGKFCAAASAGVDVVVSADKALLFGSAPAPVTGAPGPSCLSPGDCVDAGDLTISYNGCPGTLTGAWLLTTDDGYELGANIIQGPDDIRLTFARSAATDWPNLVLDFPLERNGETFGFYVFAGRQLDCDTLIFKNDLLDIRFRLARVGAAACGNQVVDGSDQCDDGNENDADGCAFVACNAEYVAPAATPEWDCNLCVSRAVGCGNGTVDPGEQCDDGNSTGYDLCLPDCTLPVCGNGWIDRCEGAASLALCTDIERCDDGAANSDSAPGACRTNCTRCGDDQVDAGEQCDDGGTDAGDGCSELCQFE